MYYKLYIFIFCLIATPIEALSSPNVIKNSDIFSSGQFDIPEFKGLKENRSWVQYPGRFERPALSITLDAGSIELFADYLYKNLYVTDRPYSERVDSYLIYAFYAYALEVWSLERLVSWFKKMDQKFPRDNRGLFAEFQIHIIYQYIWAQQPDRAIELRSLWKEQIGVHDPLDKALKSSKMRRIFPEIDRYNEEYYHYILAQNPDKGPCHYMRSFIDETQLEAYSSSHAYTAHQRSHRVTPVIQKYMNNIIEDCSIRELPQNEYHEVLQFMAGLGLLNYALLKKLNTSILQINNRCERLNAELNKGRALLINKRIGGLHDLILNLDLASYREGEKNAFKAFQCQNTASLIWGVYDANSPQDLRYALPQSLAGLFIDCLSNKRCGTDDFLFKRLDKNALKVMVHGSSGAWSSLAKHDDSLENIKRLAKLLQNIFAHIEYHEVKQIKVIWMWISWLEPDKAAEVLDELAYIFENYSEYASFRDFQSSFLNFCRFSDQVPEATKFAMVLKENAKGLWEKFSKEEKKEFSYRQLHLKYNCLKGLKVD